MSVDPFFIFKLLDLSLYLLDDPRSYLRGLKQVSVVVLTMLTIRQSAHSVRCSNRPGFCRNRACTKCQLKLILIYDSVTLMSVM